jgi:general secretion pathway protein D
MMLASVATDIQTNGRAGLPVLGLIPVLGRLFSSPTRDNKQIDIVIAVTPRVLRAPAVTPRDEEMRPSGTLQSPTTGSLAEMIKESDREDAIAAARKLPRNAYVEVRNDAQAVAAPKVGENVSKDKSATQAAQPTATQTVSQAGSSFAPASEKPKPQTVEELPAYVPAPKSLVSDRSAAQVAAVNPGPGGTNAVLTSMPKPIESSLTSKASRTALLSFASDQVLKVGEKRQFAVQLNSDVQLGLAVVTLRFDPKVVKVRSINAGELFAGGKKPNITESIDPNGICLISISALNSLKSMTGNGALIMVEIEGLAPGNAALAFDKDTMHLVAIDARDVVLEVKHGNLTVKQ